MSFNCKYCKKIFTSIGNLTKHQKTTKYCLKIQQEKNLIIIDELKHQCNYCKKDISKYHLEKHKETCLLKYQHIIDEVEKKYTNSILSLEEDILKNKLEKDKEIKYMENIINKKNEIISDNEKTILSLEIENKILKENEQLFEKESQKKIQELQERLQEIALAAIEQKNDTINNMIKKYVKKQPRKQFECSNVIYILTTSSLQKDRRYILGKAKNLTNRLSTYNKTDEHEVLFFQDCGDEETMNILEPTVFKKLNEYREQANRERFILPEDKNIDFFIDIIKNCFEFLK